LASPLSEIAYQLANTGAGVIDTQNTAVATAFGISGVDIVSTTPTDINTTAAANDDAGKFGTILAAVSQMGENSADANPTATIAALVADMADGDIGGRNTGAQTVNVVTAINNFKNGTGDNNKTNGAGAGNTDSASDFIIAIIG
jgi:predicted regulator of Ras-like GTPase activity (Roadblock/LC7/MglB family)